MVNKGYALARQELIKTLAVYTGVTSSDGEEDGKTLVDSNLIGRNDFITGKTIIIITGDARDEDKVANAFDNGDGTISLVDGFSAKIRAGTGYRILNVSSVELNIIEMAAKVGTPTDDGAAATLFGRHKRLDTAVHAHLLFVVHDASSLNADLDTPLKTLLEEFGFEVLVADPADVAGNLELNFDGVVVSASCVDADKTNLANLQYVDCPVVCHSAAIAVSAVFNLGTTAGSRASQTKIEVKDNSVQWFLDHATGDLAVTTAATIYTIATKTANAITLAEEETAVGNNITCLILPQGLEDGGDPAYAPDFDRVFFGLADAGKANDTAKDIYFHLYEYLLHEVRFSPEVVVTPKRVYQEDIPDTDFSLEAVDATLTANPPSADAENSVVDIDQKQNRTFVLRSLWVNVTNLGGTKMTFKLWVPLNGTVTEVASKDVSATGISNLVDLFALQEIHADGIWITAQTDSGTGACSGSYRYAQARK